MPPFMLDESLVDEETMPDLTVKDFQEAGLLDALGEPTNAGLALMGMLEAVDYNPLLDDEDVQECAEEVYAGELSAEELAAYGFKQAQSVEESEKDPTAVLPNTVLLLLQPDDVAECVDLDDLITTIRGYAGNAKLVENADVVGRAFFAAVRGVAEDIDPNAKEPVDEAKKRGPFRPGAFRTIRKKPGGVLAVKRMIGAMLRKGAIKRKVDDPKGKGKAQGDYKYGPKKGGKPIENKKMRVFNHGRIPKDHERNNSPAFTKREAQKDPDMAFGTDWKESKKSVNPATGKIVQRGGGKKDKEVTSKYGAAEVQKAKDAIAAYLGTKGSSAKAKVSKARAAKHKIAAAQARKGKGKEFHGYTRQSESVETEPADNVRIDTPSGLMNTDRNRALVESFARRESSQPGHRFLPKNDDDVNG